MNNDNKYIHDAYIAMAERHLKRQWIAIILLILLLTFSNLGWIYYESQFTDEETTVTQELSTSDSGDVIINDGVHINGESEADSQN